MRHAVTHLIVGNPEACLPMMTAVARICPCPWIPLVQHPPPFLLQAIRDGVIDGVLDHDAAALVSREIANVYLTKEPQEAFHRRLTFCLDVHNEAVRGMRYPPHAHRDDLEDAEARAGRDKDEAELATEIEEGDLDEEDM